MKKLDIYRKDSFILNDAFDQAVMNIHIQKEKNNYKSFVICGCDAGDGATTIAINLSAALANSGWKTVLVDGDMRKNNKYKRLNEETKQGLSNYLVQDEKLENVIYETTTPGLYYIPCGELLFNPVRALCSAKMDSLKKELDSNYDFIVFDMPAVNVAMDAKVLAVKTDATILVTAMGSTTKTGLISAANTLVNSEINLIGTIINRSSMDEYKRYRRDYDYFESQKYAKKNKKMQNKKKKDK